MSASYWDYIRVEDLLSLQGGVEGDESALSNEEVLFIVVHQVDELWFKLVLRELDSMRSLFSRDPVPETSLAAAARGLRRTCRVLRMAADHFQVMETMTPRDFLDFRDKLVPASGFQSPQFRELEILLGLVDAQRLPLGKEESYLEALRGPGGGSSPALERVQRRLAEEGTVRGAVERWLGRTPIEGSRPGDAEDDRVVREFLERFLAAHQKATEDAMKGTAATQALAQGDLARLQERYAQETRDARAFFLVEDPALRRQRAAVLFIENYRDQPLLSWPREVLDLLIEMEQAWLVFRQRHARMVERMIGRRVGTGGSDGVAYLDRTALEYRVFPDLWQVRTFLLEKARIPALQNPEDYDFAAGQG